ncbi:MAG: ribonuclease HI [Bacteroidales bacterium]
MADNTIYIYTDGSSLGNPGYGGYGVVLKSGSHYKELSGGDLNTTNNRMELLAVIIGLEALKKLNSKVIVTSDSKYVVSAVTEGWLFNWEKKKFDKKANPDLWIRFLKIYRQHQVEFRWVKGHAGHPENEICDRLAVHAAENLRYLDKKNDRQ